MHSSTRLKSWSNSTRHELTGTSQPAADAAMKAAELLVNALEAEGVEYVFGLPGEENLEFLEALRGHPDIQTVLVRQEQAAGFMAATYERLTGKIAVAYSTLGAGATNLVTSVAHASLGGFPVLFITGQKPIRENRQGLYQLLDVTGLMRPITKSARTIESGAEVAHMVHDAFRTMREGRPGPVHLELPQDVAAEETDGHLSPARHGAAPVATEASLDAAAEAIANAKSPLIMLGPAAERHGVPEAVRSLVATTNIPFCSTWMGKGVGDERSDEFVGTLTSPGLDYVGAAVLAADLVLNVGHDIAEKAPFVMSRDRSQLVIHVNTFPAHGDAIYFPQLQVVGEVSHSLRQLEDRLHGRSRADHTFSLEMARKMRDSIERSSDDPGTGPIRPQFVVARVREALADDAVVTLDNGVHKLWFTRNFPVYTPRTHIVDTALGSMGTGLPAAIAAALVEPDRQVVAVVGDGGFLMNVQELETAVRLRLNLAVVILNDSGLGMIRMKQKADGYQAFNVDFDNPDFSVLTKAFGGNGHRIVDPATIAPTLRSALIGGGVHVIDIPIDYSENNALVEEMRMAVSPVAG